MDIPPFPLPVNPPIVTTDTDQTRGARGFSSLAVESNATDKAISAGTGIGCRDGIVTGMQSVVTTRLRLTPFCRDDIPFLHRLWTDPGVRRFLWDDRVISIDEAADVVEASETSFRERDFGFWTVVRDDEPIGFVGFREFPPSIELLYALLPQHWGQGLATEASRAALDFVFKRCPFTEVYAGTDPPNAASLRVIERLGMRFHSRRTIHGLHAVYFVLQK
jgi:RimJ/RimL family protein N-acetyltransferase